MRAAIWNQSDDSLCIVIPALNEEESIVSTAERCKRFRELAVRTRLLSHVDIVVVSDGSTDRTLELARSVDGIRTIEFVQNRGYGAAIQEGWQTSDCNLLAFLDADGTCDPDVFEDLCLNIIRRNADLALGTRMGPDSQMPRIRRLGNRVYAMMLGVLCGRSVTDTASGMRVLRRSALERLGELPKGLNFTPAMSARALLGGLQVVEVPMSYAERVGESKLRIFSDGIRFFCSIIDAAFCFRPDRPFTLAFLATFMFASMLAMYPTEFYLQNGRVEEWMIYRFVCACLFGGLSLLSLSAVAVCHQLTRLGPRAEATDSYWAYAVSRLFRGRVAMSLVMLGLGASVAALWPGIVEFLTTRTCTLHWTRLIFGASLILMSGIVGGTSAVLRVISLLARESATSVAAKTPLVRLALEPDDLMAARSA